MNAWFEHTAETMWVILAMIGGIARYLDKYIRTGSPPQFGLLAAHTVVSGFSGYMTAHTVGHFQPEWTLIAAGIGGYLGTQGLDWIASIFQEKFGGKLKTPADERDAPNNGEGK